MSIDQILAQATSLAVKELYGVEFPAEKIVPQTTKKEFEGNETIVVFPFLKASHKAPDATAQEIGEHLVKHCDAVSVFLCKGNGLTKIVEIKSIRNNCTIFSFFFNDLL